MKVSCAGTPGLDDVLNNAEEVRSDSQALEISAQGIERLHQVRADDGKVIAALVQLKIAQGEQSLALRIGERGLRHPRASASMRPFVGLKRVSIRSLSR